MAPAEDDNWSGAARRRPPTWPTASTPYCLRRSIKSGSSTRDTPHPAHSARRGRTRPVTPPSPTRSRSTPNPHRASRPPHPGPRHAAARPELSIDNRHNLTYRWHRAPPSAADGPSGQAANLSRAGRSHSGVPTLTPATTTPQAPPVMPALPAVSRPIRAPSAWRVTTGDELRQRQRQDHRPGRRTRLRRTRVSHRSPSPANPNLSRGPRRAPAGAAEPPSTQARGDYASVRLPPLAALCACTSAG